MLCQRDACGFLIFLQCRLKKGLKASGFGLVSHITSREGMVALREVFVSREEIIVREELQ